MSAVDGGVHTSKSGAQFRICDCVNDALFRSAANCTGEYFSVLVLALLLRYVRCLTRTIETVDLYIGV